MNCATTNAFFANEKLLFRNGISRINVYWTPKTQSTSGAKGVKSEIGWTRNYHKRQVLKLTLWR